MMTTWCVQRGLTTSGELGAAEETIYHDMPSACGQRHGIFRVNTKITSSLACVTMCQLNKTGDTRRIASRQGVLGSHHIHTSCDFHTIFDANYVGEILIQLMWSLPLVRIYLEQEINFGLHLAFSPPMPLLALRSNLLDHLSQCHAN